MSLIERLPQHINTQMITTSAFIALRFRFRIRVRGHDEAIKAVEDTVFTRKYGRIPGETDLFGEPQATRTFRKHCC